MGADGSPVVGSVDVRDNALTTSPQDARVHEVVPVVRLEEEGAEGNETPRGRVKKKGI